MVPHATSDGSASMRASLSKPSFFFFFFENWISTSERLPVYPNALTLRTASLENKNSVLPTRFEGRPSFAGFQSPRIRVAIWIFFRWTLRFVPFSTLQRLWVSFSRIECRLRLLSNELETRKKKKLRVPGSREEMETFDSCGSNVRSPDEFFFLFFSQTGISQWCFWEHPETDDGECYVASWVKQEMRSRTWFLKPRVVSSSSFIIFAAYHPSNHFSFLFFWRFIYIYHEHSLFFLLVTTFL